MLYKLAEWDDMNIKYIECVYVWRVLRKEIKERGCFGKNVLSMGIWLGSILHQSSANKWYRRVRQTKYIDHKPVVIYYWFGKYTLCDLMIVVGWKEKKNPLLEFF